MPLEPSHLQVRVEEYRRPVSKGDARQTIVIVKLLPSQIDTCFDVTAWLVSVPFLEPFEPTR